MSSTPASPVQVPSVQLCDGGPTLSRIVYGVWTWEALPSLDHAHALFRACMRHGITTLDNADIYGDYTNERRLGEVLSHNYPEFPRESLQLVSKTGISLISKNRPEHKVKFYNTDKEHIITSAKNSVSQMNCQYLDLLLIHRPDPLMNPAEMAEAFQYLKREGVVRHFGVANFTPSQFSLVASALPPDMPLVTNQIEFSPKTFAPLFDGTLDQLLERRVKPMAWSPLRGLFGKEAENNRELVAALNQVGEELGGLEADRVALAWSLRHPSSIIPVIGTSKPERVTSAAEATRIELTRQQWFRILAASQHAEVP